MKKPKYPLRKCCLCRRTNRDLVKQRGWYYVEGYLVCEKCYHFIARDGLLRIIEGIK